MTFKFAPATKEKSRLRMAITGPSGSGKTYTALSFAHRLANGGKIALIDTESGSASKYAGDAPDGEPWVFDVLELDTYSPATYVKAINAAVRAKYDVLIIDSLSHAWSGKEGALRLQEKAGGSWRAWAKVTPIHDSMVDTILQAPLHIIATMRTKMKHVQEKDERSGRQVVRKVGMEAIQRPGMEYEFDIVVDMDPIHCGTVSKSRCTAMADKSVQNPGPDFIAPLIAWLEAGVEPTGLAVTEQDVVDALDLQTGQGTSFFELSEEKLQWIEDNTDKVTSVQLKAAKILLSETGKEIRARLEQAKKREADLHAEQEELDLQQEERGSV